MVQRFTIEGNEGTSIWVEPDRNGDWVEWDDVEPLLAVKSEPEMRAEFESWVTAGPFEKSVERYPADSSKSAWPGAYIEMDVALAWEAWKAAKAAT